MPPAETKDHPTVQANESQGFLRSWASALIRSKHNHQIRTLLQPLRLLLGRERFARIFANLPVRGRVSVRIPDGHKIKMFAGENDEITTLLFLHGYQGYEPETLDIFRHLCASSSVIFDIGANVGLYSLLAAAANPEARIFAFEPVDRVHEILRKNIRYNRFSQITPHRVAFSDFDGEVNLYVPLQETPTGARAGAPKKGKRSRAVPVQSIKGDSFMRQNALEKLDLVKIDTETTEPQVFNGMRATIERCHPKIICEVLAGRTEKELMEFFKPLGYRFWLLTDKGPAEREVIIGDPTYRFRNYLFATEPPF